MASNLRAMASNPKAMASNLLKILNRFGLFDQVIEYVSHCVASNSATSPGGFHSQKSQPIVTQKDAQLFPKEWSLERYFRKDLVETETLTRS